MTSSLPQIARWSCCALLLLAGACAPQTVWVKDGADDEEFRHDRAYCSAQGDDYRYMDDRRPGAGLGPSGADIYRRCLESLGWHRERPRR
jgi:hypothetical protein